MVNNITQFPVNSLKFDCIFMTRVSMMVITLYKGCSLENQSRYLYNEQIAIKLQCK